MPNFSPYTRHTLEEVTQTGVYGIFNLVNGKWYVGSAIREVKNNNPNINSGKGFYSRWYEHVRKLENGLHDNNHLQNAWIEYGADNFEFRILHVLDDKDAIAKEQEYLDKYWDTNHRILYNDAREAVSPMKGRKKSKDSIEKQRNSAGKSYIFITPDGKYITIKNLKKFSKENNLNYHCMLAVANHRSGNHRGWTIPNSKFTPKPFVLPEKRLKTYNFLSPNGKLVEIKNLPKFCQENNLSYTCMQGLANSKRKQHQGWTIPNSTFVGQEERFYQVISPEGKLYEFNSMYKFCKEMGLCNPAMYDVVNNKASHHKGWTVPDSKFKNKVVKTYVFLNPEGKEVIITNLEKFCKENDLLYSSMGKVHKGIMQQHKGWSSPKNPYVKKFYRYIDPEGNLHKVEDITSFCKPRGLNRDRFYMLNRGDISNYNGWTLADGSAS